MRATGARITGVAAVAVACVLVLVPVADAAPIDDYQAVRAEYQPDGQITACRFTRLQLQNAANSTPPDVQTYDPNFGAKVQAEIRRHDAGGCPAGGGNSGTRLNTTLARPRVSARQVGGRIKVKVTGRIAKLGRACNGKVSVGVRSGGKRRTRKRATVRSSCRYATTLIFRVNVLPRRLVPRNARLLVRVSSLFNGTSARLPDSAPARTKRVRR